MVEKIIGSWQLESSDNFDNFLKEIGVNWASRQAAVLAKPTLTIAITSSDRRRVVITQDTGIGLPYVVEADVDVEFDEVTLDGRQLRSTIKLVGNKLVHLQVGKVNCVVTRFVEANNADSLVVVCEANLVKATRKFTRISS